MAERNSRMALVSCSRAASSEARNFSSIAERSRWGRGAEPLNILGAIETPFVDQMH